ncbi:MAG TPA: hypothetical protein VK655_03390 [Solirubrobacteraceae bacterium]|jgi:hypothetical protein|nr:hypothetical protein [Solirubrobacteraceae bacterium]
MYHVEVRHFPHNMARFNLTDADLMAIVEPWVRDQMVEFGERKWSPQQAKITIFEGPHMPLDQLTMGRGWRAAERESENVTDAVLATARERLATPAPAPASTLGPPFSAQPAAANGALADPLTLGVQLASLLGDDPAGLLAAWREVAARSTGLSPSASLALAERQRHG